MDNDRQSDYNARANDMNRISAANTDFMDEESDIDEPAPPDPSESLEPEGFDTIKDEDTYQDALDYSDDAMDPFTNESTDDPTEELQVPPEEFKEEMDKLAIGDGEDEDEDSREAIEDQDEADDSAASYA